MNDKPTRWDYATTSIILLLCATWAYYEYYNDPTKVPSEPIIMVVTYGIALWGYLRWKKGKEEHATTNIVKNLEVNDSKNIAYDSTINADGNVRIGDETNTIVNNEGSVIKNQFNNGTFNDTTFN